MKLFATTTLVAVLCGLPALAQTTTVVPAAPSAADRAPQPQAAPDVPTSGPFLTSVSPDLMRVSKVIGIPVIGSDPVRIGKIDDLVFDRQGKVVSVVIGTGGLLGLGEKRVGVPFDTVLWSTADGDRSVTNTDVVTAGTQARQIDPATAPDRMPGSQVGTKSLDAQNQNQSGNVVSSSGTSAPTQQAVTPATALLVGPGGAANRAVVQLTKGDLQIAPEYRFDAGTAAPARP
jgi:sporulation protein YlmC with PRC-barrel domain